MVVISGPATEELPTLQKKMPMKMRSRQRTEQQMLTLAVEESHCMAVGADVLVETPRKRKRTSKQEQLTKSAGTVDNISPEKKKSRAMRGDTMQHPDGDEKESIHKDVQLGEKKRSETRRTLAYSSNHTSTGPWIESMNVTDDTASPSAEKEIMADNSPHAILKRICGGQYGQTSNVVGRIQQRQAISSLVEHQNTTETPRSLFVIGPPGTGKSTSVEEITREYERKNPSTVVLRLNCTTFYNPTALYAEISEQVHKKTSWVLPYLDPLLLEEFITEARRNHNHVQCKIILVLDEVDHLLRMPTTTQPRVKDVIRFVVQWANVSSSNFTFIGIMNGVDMHSQITAFLPHNFTVPHILFPAYDHQELQAILHANVESAIGRSNEHIQVNDVVECRSLELIARKIAARDGDARKAISLLHQCARQSLCRYKEDLTPVTKQASTSTEEQPPSKVNLRDVVQLANTMQSSILLKEMHQLPRLAKLLLYVITTLAPSNAKFACDMNAIGDELARLRASPSTAWVPVFKREDLQLHLASLDCYALVKSATKRSKKIITASSFWKTKLSSAVTMDVVTKALQGDSLLQTLPTLH